MDLNTKLCLVLAAASAIDLAIAFVKNLLVARHVLPIAQRRLSSSELYLRTLDDIRAQVEGMMQERALNVWFLQSPLFIAFLFFLRPAEWFLPLYLTLFLAQYFLMRITANHVERVEAVIKGLPTEERRVLRNLAHQRRVRACMSQKN